MHQRTTQTRLSSCKLVACSFGGVLACSSVACQIQRTRISSSPPPHLYACCVLRFCACVSPRWHARSRCTLHTLSKTRRRRLFSISGPLSIPMFDAHSLLTFCPGLGCRICFKLAERVGKSTFIGTLIAKNFAHEVGGLCVCARGLCLGLTTTGEGYLVLTCVGWSCLWCYSSLCVAL